MKIIIFSHYGVGGALKYLKGVADAFAKINYPVEFYLPGEAKQAMPPSLNSRFILKEPSVSHNIFSRFRYLKFLHHLLKYLYNALFFNPPSDCRVVHLLFPFYLSDIVITKRLKRRGIKIIITVHEVLPHTFFLGERFSRFLISILYRDADVILSHTDSLTSEIKSFFSITEDKIRVVPHGYYEVPKSKESKGAIKERYNIPVDKKILLFFGEVRGNKGLDDLLKAVRKLSNDYYLLIAGTTVGSSEPSSSYYKDLIRELAIEERVLWIDRYIYDEEIPDIFEVSDAVVLPYKGSFHAQSGVLSIAAGFEKPCVVTDVGGIGEVVKKYNIGIVVKPDNHESIREGIKILFEGKKNLDFGPYKKDNNWDSSVTRLLMVYNELFTKP